VVQVPNTSKLMYRSVCWGVQGHPGQVKSEGRCQHRTSQDTCSLTASRETGSW